LAPSSNTTRPPERMRVMTSSSLVNGAIFIALLIPWRIDILFCSTGGLGIRSHIHGIPVNIFFCCWSGPSFI
jgi:hypothetical protein